MKKFENVDIINSLRQIMNINTKHYKSDFIYDVDCIRKAALSNNAEDKRLLFMSRPSGTYCLSEKKVFTKNTPQYDIWKYYGEQTNDKILAYAVLVRKIEGNQIFGNIYELNYKKHFNHVKETAVQANITTDSEYAETIPNGLQELKFVLEREHSLYEKLPCGDFENHIKKLNAIAIQECIKQMTDEEKESHINAFEIMCDYGDTASITEFDVILYNALVKLDKSRNTEKCSVRKQIVKNKQTTKIQKSTTQKKEEISL